MSALEILGIAALGLTSGLMIGCIGIGGVILVPALVFLGGIPIKIGIPAVMVAYMLSGLVASIVFARNKSIHWSMAGWLCAGAAPTAFAGAWAASALNSRALELGLGLLILLSGLNALRTSHVDPDAHAVSNVTLMGIGAGTGFLSSLSGTGGPLVLVPVLTALNLPVLMAVGLSQAIQLPVAVAATVGNVLYSKVDLALAGVLAASLMAGSWYGARLAHALPRQALRRIVSVVLVFIGIYILANVAWSAMS
ncbi:MAG TPA: sulfite exporter TauE/SafE family protein [Pseudolabrys sp.]|nr:sulfite exporter TauE/SafE family protein [Pseudolabrys sp.]